MRVKLACGKTGAEITLPDHLDARVLEPRFAPSLADPAGAVREALEQPTAGPSLAQLARGKRSAAIAICDITRPVPNRLMLPLILDVLEAAGMGHDDIQILVATGLHREATPAELDEMIGPEVMARCRVDSHRARNLDEHVHTGRTASGTEVYTDKRFVDAEVGISLGFIEPHLMAGFSGGRKVVAIGLAGERTIKRLHSPEFMRDAKAVEGSFPDNPLHRELLQISAMAGHNFMVDVALNGSRQIAAVFTGTPAEAHTIGVEFVRKSTMAAMEERADLVITTGAGYPLDLTFYQSVKGVTAAAHIVKPGGTILVISECNEGMGGPEFSELVRTSPDSREMLQRLLERPVEVDQWQAEKLAVVAEHAKLAFCPRSLPAEDRKFLWGRSFADPQEAVDALAAELPAGATAVVIPEGPYVFAQLEPREEVLV
ncbi:MAG: nickel-dependent lactate racemase [Acidobacteria bacterium]|nr:nickel-dependent lactate racemase [Acidobacteriota bacterium]